MFRQRTLDLKALLLNIVEKEGDYLNPAVDKYLRTAMPVEHTRESPA